MNYWVHIFMYSLYSPVWDDVRRLQITPPPVNGMVVECRKTKKNMLCQFLPKKNWFPPVDIFLFLSLGEKR